VNYNLFKNINEYTSYIQSTAFYLKDLGHPLPEPFIAILLFKGLSSSFDSFSSCKYEEITNELKNNKTQKDHKGPLINISKLISDIISEESRISTNEDSQANKASPNNPFCTYCKRKTHIRDKCWILYPELRPDQPNNQGSSKKKKSKQQKSKDESSKALMSALANSAQKHKANSQDVDYIKPELLLDSGASEHYTFNRDWFINYKTIRNKSIKIADGTVLQIIGQGDIPIKIAHRGSYEHVIIKGVFYVPEIKSTLISSKELTNKGWEIIFKTDKTAISHPESGLNITANWRSNSYYLDVLIDYDLLEPVVYSAVSQDSANKKTLDLIHQRINYLNKELLIKTLENILGFSKNLAKQDLKYCDPCYIGKFTQKGSKILISRAPNLAIFDIDIAGPFKLLGPKGEAYFITITDRGSRSVWVYSLKHKGDAYDRLVTFFKMIETQFGIKIKAFKLDNTKEFKSNRFTLFCKKESIILEYTSPYSVPQNGISERLNRYIVERLITICKNKHIPLFLWLFIIQAIIYVKNRTYNSIINKTPYEELLKKKPNIDYFRVLGSLTYTLILK
jgi:transposase InsO family protein